MDKFIIWSPTGTTPPRVRFATHHAAQEIAETMARRYPGQEFFVMEAKSVSQVVVPSITRTL